MIRLAIIDEKGNIVDLDELTDNGLGQIVSECDRLKEQCEEVHRAEQED